MILTMALFSPPFLDFSAENKNEDVPIRGYFGFIHTVHLLLAVCKIRFGCGELPVDINMRRTSARSISTFVTSSVSSSTTASYFITNYPIL